VGLTLAAENFFVGLNGDLADFFAVSSLLPESAQLALNPPATWPAGECATLNALRHYCKVNRDQHILYFHMKGLSHVPGSPTHDANHLWRLQMEHVVLHQWRKCVKYLDQGFQTAGTRWYQSYTGNYYAGNFWWGTSNYLATLPEIRPEGHLAGGRYEAEVWIGRGPHPPRHVDL
jgi:hypothetical protein